MNDGKNAIKMRVYFDNIEEGKENTPSLTATGTIYAYL